MRIIANKYRVRIVIEKAGPRSDEDGSPTLEGWEPVQEASMHFRSFKSSEVLYGDLLHLLVQEKAEQRNGKDK